MKLNIIDEKKVIEIFGYWPKFCDAKFCELLFDFEVKAIAFTINYIDSDENINASIKLKFSEVSEVAVLNILSENVLDEILIIPNADLQYEISLIGCYGMHGTFFCKGIEVVSVQQF